MANCHNHGRGNWPLLVTNFSLPREITREATPVTIAAEANSQLPRASWLNLATAIPLKIYKKIIKKNHLATNLKTNNRIHGVWSMIGQWPRRRAVIVVVGASISGEEWQGREPAVAGGVAWAGPVGA